MAPLPNVLRGRPKLTFEIHPFDLMQVAIMVYLSRLMRHLPPFPRIKKHVVEQIRQNVVKIVQIG